MFSPQANGAIPATDASRLPDGTIRTKAHVDSIFEGGVQLAGEKIGAQAVVIATEGPETARLLGEENVAGSRGVTCLYFDAAETPLAEPTSCSQRGRKRYCKQPLFSECGWHLRTHLKVGP